MYNENGDIIYEGNWAEDCFEGKGTFYYGADDAQDRTKYEGEWCQGEKHGKGTMFWRNGNWYEGEWCQGARSGTGKLYDKSGKVIKTQTWKQKGSQKNEKSQIE